MATQAKYLRTGKKKEGEEKNFAHAKASGREEGVLDGGGGGGIVLL